MPEKEYPNPCEFCKGKIIGLNGRIYTCDDCPIVISKEVSRKEVKHHETYRIGKEKASIQKEEKKK